MSRGMRSVIEQLARQRQALVIRDPVDPRLDIAELTRRVYQASGPALWFQNVVGSEFSVASNLFGTEQRTERLFEKTLPSVQSAVSLKARGLSHFSSLESFLSLPKLASAGLKSVPRQDWWARRNHQRIWHRTTLSALPQYVSWPADGGAFLTLPQVLTLDPNHPRIMSSNLGMYRIQISGNDYKPDKEAGLHYQLHRGIGIHHSQAKKIYEQTGKPWKISIFMGAPAYTLAAVMPLPEGLSELMFAGMLSGRRVGWYRWQGYIILSDADFCILGEVDFDSLKPEGPFGDHLGYYSLRHDFPVLKVRYVLHKKQAVMPVTVVGRPPQEDTSFGKLIHKLTAPMVPVSLPGVREVHAVDEAGVHPLLLAIGSERYVPFQPRVPLEIITQGFAILGFNQCSLAKYLVIAAGEDDPSLSTAHLERFWHHVLSRIVLHRDIHLLTNTPLDTLDYTSQTLNHGSKALIVCAGKPVRVLEEGVPQRLDGVVSEAMVMAGIAAITVKDGGLKVAVNSVDPSLWQGVPIVVVCDQARDLEGSMKEFVWHAFTKSHPVDDLHGKAERFERKHWVFDGPLFIDARSKPHHPEALKPCPESQRRVDRLVEGHEGLKKIFS